MEAGVLESTSAMAVDNSRTDTSLPPAAELVQVDAPPAPEAAPSEAPTAGRVSARRQTILAKRQVLQQQQMEQERLEAEQQAQLQRDRQLKLAEKKRLQREQAQERQNDTTKQQPLTASVLNSLGKFASSRLRGLGETSAGCSRSAGGERRDNLTEQGSYRHRRLGATCGSRPDMATRRSRPPKCCTPEPTISAGLIAKVIQASIFDWNIPSRFTSLFSARYSGSELRLGISPALRHLTSSGFATDIHCYLSFPQHLEALTKGTHQSHRRLSQLLRRHHLPHPRPNPSQQSLHSSPTIRCRRTLTLLPMKTLSVDQSRLGSHCLTHVAFDALVLHTTTMQTSIQHRVATRSAVDEAA